MTGDFTALNLFLLISMRETFITPNYILYSDGSTFSFSLVQEAAKLSRLKATNFRCSDNVFPRSRLRQE